MKEVVVMKEERGKKKDRWKRRSEEKATGSDGGRQVEKEE